MTPRNPTDFPILREADREYVWETLRLTDLSPARQEKALQAFDRILDMIEDDEVLLSDALVYLDRPFIFWPHGDTCDVKRRDLVARLKDEA